MLFDFYVTGHSWYWVISLSPLTERNGHANIELRVSWSWQLLRRFYISICYRFSYLLFNNEKRKRHLEGDSKEILLPFFLHGMLLRVCLNRSKDSPTTADAASRSTFLYVCVCVSPPSSSFVRRIWSVGAHHIRYAFLSALVSTQRRDLGNKKK